MDETNLKEIKTTARMLLYLEPKPHSIIPTVISHPFFQNQIFAYEENGENVFLDLSQKDNLDKARKIISEKIDSATDISYLLNMLNPPYFPAFLKYTYADMSVRDMSKTLSDVWLFTEFPNHDPNLSKTEFLKLFSAADKTVLMDKDDLSFFERLPNKIKVYRGTKHEDYKALSWTLNKKKAIWFSERFLEDGEKSNVYEAEIEKKDCFAYFNSRSEKEIVLNYKKLKNIKKNEF